jgi:hypothetical protein
MIRRDDDVAGDWILIEQIKHATLAAEIARVWGNEDFQPLARTSPQPLGRKQFSDDEEHERNRARVTFAMAVSHHDDGWSEWDQTPRLDPGTGAPRDFREMRMQDATAIWNKSISRQAKILPLAAYAISRHFCFLAEQVSHGGRHNADDLAAVDRFLKRQRDVQAQLEQNAALRGSAEEFSRHRELAYRTVQFFDRVSLWLCCADEREPQSMTAPMGEVVIFSSRLVPPVTEEPASGVYRLRVPRPDYRKWHVAITPYPLSADAHEFSLEARRIPARGYTDDADLQTARNRAPSVHLTWVLGRA